MYYAEIRTSRLQFDTLLRTTSLEGAKRLARREIAKRSEQTGMLLVDSDADIAHICFHNLSRMKDERAYWEDRFSRVVASDGSFIITDKKTMVYVKFQNYNGHDIIVLSDAFYDNVSNATIDLSAKLAVQFNKTFFGGQTPRKVRVYYSIEGVDKEFATNADAWRYVNTYGDEKMHNKRIFRITQRTCTPLYVIVWKKEFSMVQIIKL